jgi:hypothetical protein
MRSVVNTPFSILMLLFVKKIKIQEKSKFTKGSNVKNKKEVKGANCF